MEINDPLFVRLKSLFRQPSLEWEKLKEEKFTEKEIWKQYTLPLVVMEGISTMIGAHSYVPDTDMRKSAIYGLISIVFSIINIWLTSRSVDYLAPYFNYQTTKVRSSIFIHFSISASLVASIISSLHVSLFFVEFFGLYYIFLFMKGSEIMFEIPKSKKNAFVISIILIHLFIGAALSMAVMQFL